MFLDKLDHRVKQIKNPYLRALAPYAIVGGGAFAFALIIMLACRSAYICENIYVPVAGFLSMRAAIASAYFSFSFAEIALYALVIWFVIYGVMTAVKIITRPGKLMTLMKYGLLMAAIASVGLFLYTLMWGQSYYRYPLAQRMDLDVKARPIEDVYKLGLMLIDEINADQGAASAAQAARDDPPAFGDMSAVVALAAGSYYGVNTMPAVKPVLASEAMAYLNLTGIYIPITGESNVSKRNTPPFIPLTMAHETAHRMCTAREDEANFEAFMILMDCDDAFARYSARIYGLNWVSNALYSSDRELWRGLWDQYPEGVARDFTESSEFWRQYRTPVAETSQKINDTFLKAQGQTDGVRSYGRALDLLLAFYLG